MKYASFLLAAGMALGLFSPAQAQSLPAVDEIRIAQRTTIYKENLPTISGCGTCNYALTASGGRGLSELPAWSWLRWRASIHTLVGTAPAAATGNIRLTYTVSGDVNDSVNFLVRIQVRAFVADVYNQTFPAGRTIDPITLPISLALSGNINYSVTLSGQQVHQLIPGMSFNPANRVLSGTPTIADRVGFHYTGRVGSGPSTVGTVNVSFFINVTGPSITNPPSTRTYDAGEESGTTLSAASSDPGAEPLTYTLIGANGQAVSEAVPGMSFDDTSRRISGTPTRVGRSRLIYRVTDSFGNTDEAEFVVSITGLLFDFEVDTLFYETGVSQDISLPSANATGTIVYSLTDSRGSAASPMLPDGLNFNANSRILSGAPDADISTTLTYTATFDGNTAPMEFDVHAYAPLALAAINAATFMAGNSGTTAFGPATGGSDDLSYTLMAPGNRSIAEAVPGLSFVLSDGANQISGTPWRAGFDGDLTYTVTDNVGSGDAASYMVRLQVTGPVFTAADLPLADQQYVVGRGVETTLPVVTDATSYDVVNASRFAIGVEIPGLGFAGSPVARALFGAPVGPTTSAATLTYTATNADGTSSATFDVEVFPALAIPDFPSNLPSYPAGQAGTITLPEAVGGIGTLTYNLSGTIDGVTYANPGDLNMPGVTFDQFTRVLSGTPTKAGDFTLTYSVTDSYSGSVKNTDEEIFMVTVTGPSFIGDLLAEREFFPLNTDTVLALPLATGSGDISYTLWGMDGDADTPNLPAGLEFEAGDVTASTAPTLSGEPTVAEGDYPLTYTAADQYGNVVERSFNVAVTALAFEAPAIEDAAYAVGDAVSITLPAAIGGSGALAYIVYGAGDYDADNPPTNGANLPAGLAFTSTDAARILSGQARFVGDITLTYRANDAGGVATANFMFTVTGGPAFGASQTIDAQSYPAGVGIDNLLLPTPDSDGFGDLSYRLIGADDGDGNTPLPPGLIFNPTGATGGDAARTLSGVPSQVAAAVNLTYSVQDQFGNSDLLTFTVAITAPVFAAATVPGAMSYPAGVDLTPIVLPTAVGGDTYTLLGEGGTDNAPNLPPGLVFNAANRELSGMPTTIAAPVTLTYSAHNRYRNPGDDSNSTAVTFTVQITGPTFASPAPGNQIYTVGRPIPLLVLPAAASTGSGDLTYTLRASNGTAASPNLPGGLTFNATVTTTGDAARTLTGTPDDVATTTLTYTASDGEASTRLMFTVTVNPGVRLPTIAAFTYAAGATVTEILPAVDAGTGTGDITYALFSDGVNPIPPNLPTGLTFNATGTTTGDGARTLSGTPTAKARTVLTYMATDSALPTANMTMREFTIVITGPDFDGRTQDDLALPVGVEITPRILPAVDSSAAPVSYTLTGAANSSGGNLPLPGGLVFNADSAAARTLSGTPTVAAAAVTLIYTAIDAYSNETALTFSVAIDQVLVDVDGNRVTAAGISEMFAMPFMLGVAVNMTLPRVPGDAPHTYTLTGPDDEAVALAVPGLTFDHSDSTLSGMPTDPDSVDLTYTACPAGTNPCRAPAASGGNSASASFVPSEGATGNAGGLIVSYTFTFTVAAPMLLEAPMTPLLFVLGEEIDPVITLPAASGGISPYTYALIGPDDVAIDDVDNTVLPGLSFNAAPASRILSGTPTMPGAVTLTYRVTDSASDSNGDPNIINEFIEVTVSSGSAALAAVNEVVLPQVASAMTASATAAITTRIERANGGGNGFALGGQTSLAAALAAHGQPKAADQRDSKTMLAGTSFSLALNGGHGGYGVAGTTAGYAAGGSGATVLWGSGEYRELSGDSGGVDWGGELYGFHLGVDTRVRHDLLLGVAVSKLQSDIDYRGAAAGAHGMDMTSVNPYLGWQVGGVDLWAALGYGQGELEITPSGGAAVESDVSLRALGLGGSGEIWQQSATTLRLRGEISRAELEVEGAALAMQTATTRAHFGLEARGRRALGGGAIEPSVEFGLRYNGGDGETGTAAQVGAGLRFSGGRYSAHGRIHAVIMPGEYSEWGAHGSIAMAAGADGQGFSLELSPSYGPAQSDMAQLWQRDLPPAATAASADYRASMEARLAYGLALKTTAAMLTPYGEMRLGSTTAHRLGINWRSASHAGSHATLNLVGERRQTPAAAHTILLKGELQF